MAHQVATRGRMNGLIMQPKTNALSEVVRGNCARVFTVRVFTVSVLAFSVSACSLFASDPDFQGGFYAGAGVGMSNLEPNADNNAAISLDETKDMGMQVTAGYDLTSRLSVEGHYSDLGEATLSPAGSVGYSLLGASGLIYGLNDRDDRNLRQGFSVFGRLGLASLENESTVPYEQLNDVQVLAGAGIEYNFWRSLSARAEVISFDSDAQYAQLGLLYRFGDRSVARSAPVPPPMPEPVAEVVIPEPATIIDIPDTDGDGVPNAVDDCPSTTPGGVVDDNGCDVFNVALQGVTFASGSAELSPESEVILRDVADKLNTMGNLRVTVEAHTDNQGSAASNLELSRQRALTVARFLVAEGIAGERLRPQAYGESRPIESNATPEGRRNNRRVEIRQVQSQ